MEKRVDKLRLETGIDIPVPELKLTIKQPRIDEIAMIGELEYFEALSILKVDKVALEIDNEEIFNWDILNKIIKEREESETRTLLNNFLQLFFLERVTLGPRSLIIQRKEGLANVEPQDFDAVREIILAVGGSSLFKQEKEEFKPGNRRAAEIAEKMKKARKKIAQSKPQRKGRDLLTPYIKAVTTLTGHTHAQVNKMTIQQLVSVYETYIKWEQFNLDAQRMMAGGGKSGEKITHWSAPEDDGVGTI